MKTPQKPILKLSHLFSRRQIFSVYRVFEQAFKLKKGRSFRHDALTHAVLFLFKMRFNLPDRALEVLFDIDHVTISRMIGRVLSLDLNISYQAADAAWYIVDTSHVFAAKGCSKEHQTGYKGRKGIKVQVVIDDKNRLVDVRTGIPVRDHDHKIFKEKYAALAEKLDKKLPIWPTRPIRD